MFCEFNTILRKDIHETLNIKYKKIYRWGWVGFYWIFIWNSFFLLNIVFNSNPKNVCGASLKYYSYTDHQSIDRSTEMILLIFFYLSIFVIDECIHITYASIHADSQSFGGFFLICNVCDAILGAVIFQSVLSKLPISHSPFQCYLTFSFRLFFFKPMCACPMPAPTDIRSM